VLKISGGRSGYIPDVGGDGGAKQQFSAQFSFLKTPLSSRRISGGRGRPGTNRSKFTLASDKSTTTTPFSLSSRLSAFGESPATLLRKKNGHSASFHIVCALSENLARETCVSSLDASSPTELCVTKQANGQTYNETIAYLALLQPHEVLLNEGRQNSQLAKKVMEMFNPTKTHASLSGNTASVDDEEDNSMAAESHTVVKFVPRAYFDQTKGGELLFRVARDGTYDASVVEEYIILASSYAVLHYTQHCLGASFTKGSLHLNVNSGGKGRMTIDRSSLLNLEILSNARTGKSKSSLIGTIDCTKTNLGSRLLRTNLMAPPTSSATINARLDAVDSMLNDEDLFYDVLEHLETLPDIDKMLAHLSLTPRTDVTNDSITARVASKGISALVCIKSCLSVIPSFSRVLATHLEALDGQQKAAFDAPEDERNSVGETTSPMTKTTGALSSIHDMSSSNQRHTLLRAILSTMRQASLREVLAAVEDIFTESTTYTSNPHAMRHQECFALKPNTDGIMDILRKAFLANVDGIYRLADEYAETYNITVTVKETTARGYYLLIPINFSQELPNIFIQPVISGRYIHCTTEEVHSLNARAQENVQDLLLMTHESIQEVIDFARVHFDSLASLSDAIALLDMLHSFADISASSSLPWCRPIITEGDGALAIRNGRYAVDVSENGITEKEFVANDTFAAPFQNFTIITGVNGSGKSTYLKQVAISVILAQCGSHVPAEEAFIPIRDRLCTRIGTSDDQEHNISTFMQEMKETAFICNQCTDRSLVLIDELGRATSNEDGVAVAWSVSEFLLVKKALTFFVTHYTQLTRLADVYSNVQNQHLGIVINGSSDDEIQYTHKVLPGPCKASADYGIEMANTCGWPIDVIREARNLRTEVEQKMPDETLCKAPTVDLLGIHAVNVLSSLAKHLVALKESSGRLSKSALRSYLEDLRNRLIPLENTDVVAMMNKVIGKENAGNTSNVVDDSVATASDNSTHHLVSNQIALTESSSQPRKTKEITSSDTIGEAMNPISPLIKCSIENTGNTLKELFCEKKICKDVIEQDPEDRQSKMKDDLVLLTDAPSLDITSANACSSKMNEKAKNDIIGLDKQCNDQRDDVEMLRRMKSVTELLKSAESSSSSCSSSDSDSDSDDDDASMSSLSFSSKSSCASVVAAIAAATNPTKSDCGKLHP